MDNNLLDELSTSKFQIPRTGKYTISPAIDHDKITLTIAYGPSLATARIYQALYSRPESIELEFNLDDGKPQFVWILAWIKPDIRANGNLVFGKEIGENGDDIARVDFDWNDDNENDELPVLGTIPQVALIPEEYKSNKNAYQTAQTRLRVNVVHNGQPGERQANAIVLLTQQKNRTPTVLSILAFWDGEAKHTNAINLVNNRTLHQLRFCALIKSISEPTTNGKGIKFTFQVGDPRREAMVTLTEEA